MLRGFGISRNLNETPEDGSLAFLTPEPSLDVGPRERFETHQAAPPTPRTDRGIDTAERDSFRDSLHGHFSCGSPSNPGAEEKVRETLVFLCTPRDGR